MRFLYFATLFAGLGLTASLVAQDTDIVRREQDIDIVRREQDADIVKRELQARKATWVKVKPPKSKSKSKAKAKETKKMYEFWTAMGWSNRQCPCGSYYRTFFIIDHDGYRGSRINWQELDGTVTMVEGMIANALLLGFDQVDIRDMPPTTDFPDLKGLAINSDAKKHDEKKAHPRNCHQALVEFGRNFTCTDTTKQHDETCMDAITHFAINGSINGKFAETPHFIRTTAGECNQKTNNRTVTCDMKAWRFRDWESEPSRFGEDLQWQFVDWMGGGAKVPCW